ncbi:LacI family DNA-binding transcriptional regulator [Cerasicoccus arenae]|uniref:HTH lacI-type domain-containing protein n=1 Tax=Cerasicoccus arenae TaxID=424488 RepID=A0A8J3GDM8_9BACT|nr:LacI family DNA-binding transcriptional regulator [Cerasicoccus arenae]MBK1857439.1 LacI family DNA-binding transcriptional regulator [Cerasicoccus arenae]GHC07710.1 hypothetical protein GCM10007047_26090 [Cerasicoccus arenae]
MNMKTLAEHCGVSIATVSYALRDDKRISETVRLHIRKKARELGYRTNSLGSSLVAYRQDVRQRPTQSTVAVLFENPPHARRTVLFQPHLASFRQSIERYGYKVEEIYLDNMEITTAEFAQSLHDKGIRGIVLAWGLWSTRLKDFPWNEFTVVSAERNEIHPALDRISMNHFSATDECFLRLSTLGAKRIGLICHDDLPLRVKKNIVGAYLMNAHSNEHSITDIPPYFYNLAEPADHFAKWFKQYRLDALLSHRLIDLNFFHKAGLHFPEDAHYAVIEIDDDGTGPESGVTLNEELGRVLADTIAGKLHYDESVDPASEGNLILVDGHWKAGTTTN